jgi:hypothetical protein
MGGIMKRELKLLFVPEILTNDFKGIVEANYFDEGIFDLKSLARNTDVFSLYRQSYLETGDPYDSKNEYALLQAKAGQNVIINDIDEIETDVQILLEFYRMFYSLEWTWRGEYINCRNMPNSSVW